MAKSRRNRAGQRKDPLAKPKPTKPPSDPELAALRTSKILPVIADLQSADPKQRASAASAIANIITDDKCRKLLLREQIVHTILTQTLTDNALESRSAGWDILRVLVEHEEPDFCVHLYRQDVLTAADHAAKTAVDKVMGNVEGSPEFSKLPEAERATVLSIIDSLLSITTALAEAQDDILRAILQHQHIFTLLDVTVAQLYPIPPSSTTLSDALNCLMILTEDNAQLSTALFDARCAPTLLKLKDETTPSGVLACGVLHNVAAAISEASESAGFDLDEAQIIVSLSKTLEQVAQQSASFQAQDSEPALHEQLAIEILASIGTDLISHPADEKKPRAGKHSNKPKASTGDDEEMGDAGADEGADDDVEGGADGAEQEENDDDDEEDDEMDADAMEADMEMVTGADEPGADTSSIPLLAPLLNYAVPPLMRLSSAETTKLPLQSLALSALNNIAWSLSLLDASAPANAPVLSAWRPAAAAIWTAVVSPILGSDTADVALATQVTSLAWAVARVLHGEEIPLREGEHRRFLSLYQATKGSGMGVEGESPDPFQGLGVKCIGVLGQLALHPAPSDLNREIGTFLVTIVASLPDTPPADIVEALNQLFDIYGDEEYPYDKQVFWANDFLKHLQEAVPKVKAMLKTIDKRAQPELRARADEASFNLSRFLGYKRKHQPKA